MICDSCHPRILTAIHADPGDLWKAIINTDTLGFPELPLARLDSSRPFVRIPLRIKPENQTIHSGEGAPDFGGDYWFEGCYYRATDPVIVYHNTQLTSLVGPTQDLFSPARIGQGILKQQRLHYGTGTHAHKSGVNFHADGCWCFDGYTGWVQLECEAVCTSKLSDSWKRYCVRGKAFAMCRKVVLRALWVPYDELPPLIFFTT